MSDEQEQELNLRQEILNRMLSELQESEAYTDEIIKELAAIIERGEMNQAKKILEVIKDHGRQG